MTADHEIQKRLKQGKRYTDIALRRDLEKLDELDVLLERFNKKWVLNPKTGCWDWTAAKNQKGYGAITVKGKSCRAHRISYQLYEGSIPDGLTLDHQCLSPGCVNPEHLKPMTTKENNMKGNSLPAVNKRKKHCIKGHELEGGNLKIVKRKTGDRRVCRECDRTRKRNWYRQRYNSPLNHAIQMPVKS